MKMKRRETKEIKREERFYIADGSIHEKRVIVICCGKLSI
jgi:hypothetical protein